MPKMLGHKVKVMASKAVTIKVVVVARVRVMGRPMTGPTSWMPMRSRGI